VTLAAGLGDLPRTALVSALLSLPLITVYLLYALGIVVIYRASRVLNLAHGAMAAVPAYLFYSFGQHLPPVVALVLAVVGGALLGMGVERGVVRRLRRQGPTAQTVGTIAVLGLAVAVLAKIYGTASLRPAKLFPDGVVRIGLTGLRYGQIAVFLIGLAMAAALFALFRWTGLGLAMRASADNRRGARLMGMDTDRTTALAWALGGGLAALAGVLVGSLSNIHPYTLAFQVLPAFVAVLLGGLESLPGAMLGAAAVGLVQGEVPALALIPGVDKVATAPGFPQLVLLILTIVIMCLRGSRLVGSQVRDETLVTVAPAVVRDRVVKHRYRPVALVLALGVAVLPFLPIPFSVLGDATLACFFLCVALSVVLLTGWVGQISLAQAEFVGIGAFVTALLANNAHIPFPASLPIAMAAGGLVAALLGIVALRVRGLYLAVATLVFAWMADTFLFNQSWFGITSGAADIVLKPLGRSGSLPYFDFNDLRQVYLVLAAFAATVIYAMANVRESKTGRAFFAVRGSEVAAASLGIDVTRVKLLAFLGAGSIAGGAGCLYMVYLRSVTPDSVNILASLFFLSVAVIGGLESLGGAVAAAIVFAALQEVFFRVHSLAGSLDIVAAALLLTVLLGYPGGLAAVATRAGPWLDRVRPRKAEEPEPEPDADGPAPVAPSAPAWEGYVPLHRPVDDDARPLEPVLRVEDVTVRFGGLVAVDQAHLEVRAGEIVGLIGANGAGKTTMFNVISGLVPPTHGSVELFGREVTGLGVHERAALGVARTFQDIQLFPQLDVFENLLVATHLENRSRVAGNIVVSRGSATGEGVSRNRVREVLGFLGLEDLAHRSIADLSFGLLRLVEVARTLVTGARLVLLDEPASGLDNAETDRLAELLLYVRDTLGVSMLVVEHDVRTVTALSDYMYVLDQGRLIGEGRPREVQRSEAVISSYLGQSVGAGA
jgi:ABC-type branched-subunit amino acid transport system ATPase component/branched-subunit amino acid ABC-type transport system permease component